MYSPQSIQDLGDYQACIEFHGHTCMGVTIGYLASKLALGMLDEMRSEDEELIVIVENDACCCDAIQVLTGCTFGKGNFFYRDYGKMAFTFGSRTSGRGLRLLLKPEIFEIPKREKYLAEKLSTTTCSKEELKEYEILFEKRGKDLFSLGPKGFFDVETIEDMNLPPLATRAQSVACDLCGEMVMETKLTDAGGNLACRSCQN
jgi:formylmethanofuran dehydrogenase subunit E